MTTIQKGLIANFLSNQTYSIKYKRKLFNIKKLKKESDDLAKNLSLSGLDKATAHQHVEDALRYLAFMLADCALHPMAKKVSIILNIHRMKCDWYRGNKLYYILKIPFRFLLGFTHSPQRLVVIAILTWVLFAFIFWLFSTPGNPVISSVGATGDFKIEWYLCFSVETLISRHGTFHLNIDHPEVNYVYILATIEALLGYIFLGSCIALFIKGVTHPYARVSTWLNEYINTIRKPSDKKSSNCLYISNWINYSKEKRQANKNVFRRKKELKK